MSTQVKDDHRLWDKIKYSAQDIDGLELRIGILDPRIAYPSTRGSKGAAVAKVAGVHQIHRAISAGYDARSPEIDAAQRKILVSIHQGRGKAADLIYDLIGKPVRDAMRSEVYRIVKRNSGRMAEALRATVFRAGRLGSRGAASAGTVMAGDDPKRPKATEKI